MGDIANFALIKDKRTTLHRSQWGTPGIPDLLYRGPAATLDSIHRDTEPSNQLYLAGGSVVVNLDESVLLFYGGSPGFCYSECLQRFFLELLKGQWPGWHLTWARDYLYEIAHYLRVDVSKLLLSSTERIARWTASITDVETDPGSETSVVVTLRNGEAEAIDFACKRGVCENLSVGPQLLEVLGNRPAISPPSELAVYEGALINVLDKTITVWGVFYPTKQAVAFIAERWPGWRVELQVGGWADQVHKSGRDAARVRASLADKSRAMIEALNLDPAKWNSMLRRDNPSYLYQKLLAIKNGPSQG
jgi:hypothetical protein